MMRFAEIVAERNGPNLDPEELRAAYQSRLDLEIERRASLIRRGDATQDDFVVFGARPFLEFLRSRNITPIVLSSTVQERVREEAELLGLTGFFGTRINGGTGDPTQFSKKLVLERILHEEGIAGDRLLSIGDGPIELTSAKELGGLRLSALLEAIGDVLEELRHAMRRVHVDDDGALAERLRRGGRDPREPLPAARSSYGQDRGAEEEEESPRKSHRGAA